MSSKRASRAARVVPLLLAGAALLLIAAKSKQCVPTPKELICEKDSECGGPAPADVACDGGWACVDAGCQWVCDEPPADVCYSSSQCGPGKHCTVDDGACGPDPGCGGSFDCLAVCTGICVDNTSTECWSDYDCPKGMTCQYAGGASDALIWCPPCEAGKPCEPCGAPWMGICVASSAEICDGLDNDGDGWVDEDGVCGSECWSDGDCPAGWYCDGEAGGGACPPCDPNGTCAPCLYQGGTCQPLNQQCWNDWECPAGTWCDYAASDYYCPPCDNGICPPCMPPYGVCVGYANEICDGLDNDGDGQVDEDGVCGGAECMGDYDCPAGWTCDYTGGGGACPPCEPNKPCAPCFVAYGMCVPPADIEVCDGIDNDGDGVIDWPGCNPPNECKSDMDCGPGAVCTQQWICWDFCDPNGGCGGGCGTTNVCSKAP